MASNSPPVPHTGKSGRAEPDPPCNPHVWILKPPENPDYTVEQKLARLRAQGDVGSLAEAAAAEHNKVTDGNDMSGANKTSKMFQVCAACDAMGGEIDHVNRDEAGRISEVVEVKGGKCKVRVKLQGPGATTASDVISKAPELQDLLITIL